MKKEDKLITDSSVNMMVSKPPHYQSNSGLEVIDVINAFTEDLNGIEATDTGNIIKYACRWKKKNGVQDLKKLIWYAQHLIDHIEKTIMSKKSVADAITAAVNGNGEIEIEFDSLQKAEKVLETAREIVTTYGVIFADDICNLVGTTCGYKGVKYGWDSMDDFRIISIPDIIVNKYRYIVRASDPKRI